MTNPTPTAYDQVLYPNYTFPQTHPDRLASIARLYGMKPADITHCRVLELGCGDGNNIVPMAYALPQAQFVGLDIAAVPIQMGQARIAQLGLSNIQLQVADLGRLDLDLGEFDFIICHGIYSWVPAEVRASILAICQAHLAPQGVAYISYNAYPGCHLREVTRDMMRFHTRGITDENNRTAQARSLVKWLANSQVEETAYAAYLKEVDDRLDSKSNGALFHDDLADINQPFYFHEFASAAAQYGLQYLSEAVLADTQDHEFAPEVGAQLNAIGEQDPLAREQYLDFLKGRTFRQTLLCHHSVNLDRNLQSSALTELYVRSEAAPASVTPDIRGSTAEKFRSLSGAAIVTDTPLAKAAMFYLYENFPRFVPFAEMVMRAGAMLVELGAQEDAMEESGQDLAAVLLKTYCMGVTEVSTQPTPCELVPSQYPQASPLVRQQVREGVLVTSLFHTNIKVDGDLSRQLLLLLDGTRSRQDVAEIFTEILAAGAGKNLTPAATQERDVFVAALPEQFAPQFAVFARMGLLIA